MGSVRRASLEDFQKASADLLKISSDLRKHSTGKEEWSSAVSVSFGTEVDVLVVNPPPFFFCAINLCPQITDAQRLADTVSSNLDEAIGNSTARDGLDDEQPAT